MVLLFNLSETDPTTSGATTSDNGDKRKYMVICVSSNHLPSLGFGGVFLDTPASLQSQLFSIFLADMQMQVQAGTRAGTGADIRRAPTVGA